jgi:hypothetical protein
MNYSLPIGQHGAGFGAGLRRLNLHPCAERERTRVDPDCIDHGRPAWVAGSLAEGAAEAPEETDTDELHQVLCRYQSKPTYRPLAVSFVIVTDSCGGLQDEVLLTYLVVSALNRQQL